MIENEVNVLLTNEGETSGFNKLKEHGYYVYHFPMIRTEPNPNAEPFKVEAYDYFIFTSKNAQINFCNGYIWTHPDHGYTNHSSLTYRHSIFLEKHT